jgi:hypothetical protein
MSLRSNQLSVVSCQSERLALSPLGERVDRRRRLLQPGQAG